jgi:hypothetical protein
MWGDADKRRFTTLVQRSTDFVGTPRLAAIFGTSIRRVCNARLSTLDDALRLHMIDFAS